MPFSINKMTFFEPQSRKGRRGGAELGLMVFRKEVFTEGNGGNEVAARIVTSAR